jgi:hypothetical protein
MNRKDFQKGVLLALKEPAWQKYIKIPKSEIATYVNLMDHFNVPGRKTILNKFRAIQVANFKRKQKASYSYILTFQLLQDLRKAKKIDDLFSIWKLKPLQKIEAGKLLAGLLKKEADKKLPISGMAESIPWVDVFDFFALPKLETKAFEKIFSISLGGLSTGISLFLMPTTLNPVDDEEMIRKAFENTKTETKTENLAPEMTFTDADADDIEKQLAEEKQLDKDLEYENKLREETENKNKKTSWKKKVTKQVIKKGVPVGIFGLLLKKGVETFGNMAPFFLAYMAFDLLDDKKKKGKK